MYCSICGSSIGSNDKFCGSCGSKVETTSAPESPSKGYTSAQPNQNEYIPVSSSVETKPWQQESKPWQSPAANSQSVQNSGAWSESYQTPTGGSYVGTAVPGGKKRMSDPKEMYDEPNSLLKAVIILVWISFFIWLIFAALTAFFIIPLIITGPLAYLFYWLAKMLRRYHDGARITVIVLYGIGVLSIFSGPSGFLSGAIGIFCVYVLAFHEDTKRQFEKYNTATSGHPPQPMY